MPDTAKRTARVPILGKDGRISDDYIPAAIGEGVESAEAAAKRAETAATNAEGSATAASKSAAGAQGSASAAEESADQARESATAASGAVTQAQSAQQAAEAAKTGAESARDSAQTAASQAQQSATAAQQSAASVADKFITSAQATTLEPGSQATASVESQVLTIGVPKGEKGDKGDQGEKGDTGTGVPDGGTPGQLLSKTDSGTAWVDPPSGNVLTGEAEGYVAHADDAYAQKPREVRVKGKTWVNRWPVISGTANGITVATDGTGLVTVTGTATADADVTADVSGWATGKSYTTMVSATPTGCSAYFEVQKPSGNTSINATTTGATLNVASDATECVAGVHVDSGTTVNASFRVMLVDGTEAPDCFTPCASITSAQPENLVTSGKNLLRLKQNLTQTTIRGITFTPKEDGSILVDGTNDGSGASYLDLDFTSGIPSSTQPDITPLVGSYIVASGNTGMVNISAGFFSKDGHMNAAGKSVNGGALKVPAGAIAFRTFLSVASGQTVNNVTVYPQIELGSTATAYEPPNVTTTPLPEVELRSLPNGTCDELVIRADGTCEVERKIGEAVIDAEHPASISLLTPASGDNLPYAIAVNVLQPFESSNAELVSTEMYSTTWPRTTNLKSRGVYRTWNSIIFVDERFTDKETAQSIINETGGTFVAQVPSSTEPQSPVILPVLPAPTFNQYHDSLVPSDTSTQYVRDINIVLDNLAKQVAGTASAVAVREASIIEEE